MTLEELLKEAENCSPPGLVRLLVERAYWAGYSQCDDEHEEHETVKPIGQLNYRRWS